jgi:hypothetical protein
MESARMAAHRRKTLAVFSLMLLGAVALAGDGENLRITNDSIIDIFVTVQDTSTKPSIEVVAHQRVNGFASIPISVSTDATGLANVSWTAVRVDGADRRCGRGEQRGLNNDATVNVHADSDCPGN